MGKCEAKAAALESKAFSYPKPTVGSYVYNKNVRICSLVKN